MVDLLGSCLTPVFLFDQERVLGSQRNGTKPIRRSLGHSPSARSVNREDMNFVSPPGPTTPFTFQVTHFQWSKEITSEVPITIQALPFLLSQNTLEGDDWVEEEGLGKVLISNVLIKN